MLIVELDYEVKKNRSIFSGRSGIYEKHRKQLIQPEIVISRSFFERERNISQALLKQKGIDEVKKPEEIKGDPTEGYGDESGSDEDDQETEQKKQHARQGHSQPPSSKNTRFEEKEEGIKKIPVPKI